MFRDLLTQTGLPHFLLTLLLIGIVIYTETSMQERVRVLPAISIATAVDDSFEQLSVESIDLTQNSEDINALVQLFATDKAAFNAREKNQLLLSLSAQEKLAMTVALAHEFFTKHNFSKVIKTLDGLNDEQRINSQLQFMYAFSLSKMSKTDRAIQQYNLLLTHQPRSQAATLNLGILLKKEKRCEQAIAVFERSVDISSGRKKAKGLSGMANCYRQLGQYQKAIENYKKSIEFRPGSSPTWMVLARSLASNNEDIEQVIDAFDKGIALDAQNYKYYIQKAEFQIKHFDFLDALSTLEKARSFSNNARIYEMMVWLHIENGRRAQANKFLAYLTKNAFTKGQRKHGELLNLYVDKEYKKLTSYLKSKKRLSEELQYLKAIAYRKSGFFKSASRILEKLSSSKEFGWRAKIHLARIARSRKQYDEANRLYESLLTHNSNAAFLWFENALVHEKTVQPESGLLKIKNAIQLQPENLVYKLAKVRLLKMSGDLPRAVKIIDSVLAQTPRYIRALRHKAELYAALNDTDNQIKTYKKLIKLADDDYATIEKLAETYISLDRIIPAQQMLLTLLDEQSHNITARYLLADSYYQSNEFNLSLNEIKKILRLDNNNLQAKRLKQSILSKIASG